MIDEPGSFYICTETSPRCYIIQKVCGRPSVVLESVLLEFACCASVAFSPRPFLPFSLPFSFPFLAHAFSSYRSLSLSLPPHFSLSLSVVVSRSRPCVYTLVVVPFDASPLTHAFVRRRRRSTARQLTACCSFVAATDALTSTPDNCHTFTSGASTVNCSKTIIGARLSVLISPPIHRRSRRPIE